MMSDRPNVTVLKDSWDVTFQKLERCKKANVRILKADIMLLKSHCKISRSQYAMDRSKAVLNKREVKNAKRTADARLAREHFLQDHRLYPG